MAVKEFDTQFFVGPQELRAWFEENHATASELYIGFYKKGDDTKNISYLEAIDQALCFGWIDSTLRRIDDRVRAQRFSPRKKKSYWSAINIAKIERLTADGQMHPSGLQVFENRDRTVVSKYSFEQTTEPEFDPGMIETFQQNAAAWAYFEGRSASYKKRIIWWIVSAKKPETRASRLVKLIETSAAGKQLD
ncbi:YdeI/OmpD-associated family protein [soil metagenome]